VVTTTAPLPAATPRHEVRGEQKGEKGGDEALAAEGRERSGRRGSRGGGEGEEWAAADLALGRQDEWVVRCGCGWEPGGRMRWEGRTYIGRVRGGESGPVVKDGPASPIRLCREEYSCQKNLFLLIIKTTKYI
jgi:hypothetical protein